MTTRRSPRQTTLLVVRYDFFAIAPLLQSTVKGFTHYLTGTLGHRRDTVALIPLIHPFIYAPSEPTRS